MGQVSPGETIKGKVLIVKNSDKENKKIKKAEIVLSATELAIAYGSGAYMWETTTFEKYDYDQEIYWIEAGNSFPIEFDIPEQVSKRKRNYIGKYSTYFWLIEIKLDIARARDIHIKTAVEIV